MQPAAKDPKPVKVFNSSDRNPFSLPLEAKAWHTKIYEFIIGQQGYDVTSDQAPMKAVVREFPWISTIAGSNTIIMVLVILVTVLVLALLVQ